MKKRVYILVSLLACALVINACAKPPVEDMENAAAAVARAEADADVPIYAPGGLARARDSLGNMRIEAESKRYDEAKRLAAEAIALAEKAIQDARNGVIRARDEATNAIAIMDNAITETNQTIENARTARQRALNFGELDSEFMAAKTGADAARNANSEKRYREAIDTSSGVRAQLSQITAKIGQTTIAASRKK